VTKLDGTERIDVFETVLEELKDSKTSKAILELLPHSKHTSAFLTELVDSKYMQKPRPEDLIGAAMCMAELLMRFKETNDPHFMDAAIIECETHGIPITATLQRELTVAAKFRMDGIKGKEAKAVKKERVHMNALMLMANLHIAGMSIPDASKKAQTPGKGGYTASTLEKHYRERMRPMEAEMRKHLAKQSP